MQSLMYNIKLASKKQPQAMDPLDQIRKEIHTALSCVSQLCEQFFRKYPQHYPTTTTIAPSYQPYFYGGYLPLNPEFQTESTNSRSRYNNLHPTKEPSKDLNNHKYRAAKNQPNQKLSKKVIKEEKKYQKNLEKLRIQRQKEQQRLKKLGQMLKKKKKERNTKKNMIKRDPRYAQKPKFPMSPYFLFLQEMRAKNSKDNTKSTLTNKQFAEKMGEKWREMPAQIKKPYVVAYVKEKKIFDEKLARYYQKYPDLKPEGKRTDKPLYAVDDPKYNEAENEEQQLETDLIDELPSEEENSEQQKGDSPVPNEKDYNPKNCSNQHEQENQEYEYDEEWNHRKDSLSQERITADNNCSNPFREVVQID